MHQCVNVNLIVISKLVIWSYHCFCSFEDIYSTLILFLTASGAVTDIFLSIVTKIYFS